MVQVGRQLNAFCLTDLRSVKTTTIGSGMASIFSGRTWPCIEMGPATIWGHSDRTSERDPPRKLYRPSRFSVGLERVATKHLIQRLATRPKPPCLERVGRQLVTVADRAGRTTRADERWLAVGLLIDGGGYRPGGKLTVADR
jgi:hypothetical protein